ncbi:MAG: hypothetical protein IJH38_01750 [Clostridia bacterium]|nr:hypothetical protein [Clostridia bacterium]
MNPDRSHGAVLTDGGIPRKKREKEKAQGKAKSHCAEAEKGLGHAAGGGCGTLLAMKHCNNHLSRRFIRHYTTMRTNVNIASPW